MRSWPYWLALILIAAAAAFSWHWLAADPGQVLLRVRGTTIETSVVAAAGALLLAFALLVLAWRLLRWPFRAWARARHRRGRERLATGLTAYAEGEYAQAERELDKAAQQDALRTPALLAAARAAYECGAPDRAAAVLAGVGPPGARAAEALRAQILLDEGRAAEALALLRPAAAANGLTLRGWRLLVEAALASGEPEVALQALPALARSRSLAPDAFARLESRVLAAALAAAADRPALDALWSKAGRAQRRRPELVLAFARRASALAEPLAAMDELESALRREWNRELALCYATLPHADPAQRLRRLKEWRAAHPGDAGLLAASGRLLLATGERDAAQDALRESLALEPSAAAWESLGDLYRGDGDVAAAADCYAHALRAARGEPTGALPPPLEAAGHARPRQVEADPHEERSEHGVPRLAGPG